MFSNLFKVPSEVGLVGVSGDIPTFPPWPFNRIRKLNRFTSSTGLAPRVGIGVAIVVGILDPVENGVIDRLSVPLGVYSRVFGKA